MKIAKFEQHRNDMHWSVYDVDDGFIRWGGYDDAYWWDKVSLTDNARTRVGKKTGRIFTIEFDTCVVTVVSPANIKENRDV